MTKQPPNIAPERGIFCNRTLNLRSIRAIGYDMDYTLVHYNVEHWEARAYQYTRGKLIELGWPIEHLEFDKSLMIRGLVVDQELGNVVKANRFGYVKQAFHGPRPMDFKDQKKAYSRTLIDLNERNRFAFLNTLFSLSEACIYSQLVELLDRHELPGVMGYSDLYARVRNALDESHAEGMLKGEIVQDPERFVDRDPDTAAALLDQKNAGKKLVLITNSGWNFTNAMMTWAFDEFLPDSQTWQDLFEFSIVEARKPSFFELNSPTFKVDTKTGLLDPTHELSPGGVFWGGNAAMVEKQLGLSGDEILYVGDHIFGDVKVSKVALRWRTALVLRELERDIQAECQFSAQFKQLNELMQEKEEIEFEQYQMKIESQRLKKGYGTTSTTSPKKELDRKIEQLRIRASELDEKIAPLARAAAEISNPNWGLLMRAGNDKSHLARQVEKSADIYMSRVANFLPQTPFAFLRSARGSLPHDQA